MNEAFAAQLLDTRTTSFAFCADLVQYRVREAEDLQLPLSVPTIPMFRIKSVVSMS